MQPIKNLIMGLTLLALSTTNANAVENYLATSNSIQFNDTQYELVWSSHPNQNYYKQEYLPKGQTLNSFTSMLTVDFIEGNYGINNAVAQKIQELETLKKTNPFVNYDVLKKDDSYIIDFLLSQNAPNGSFEIVERNVYRYVPYEQNGTKGILLLAASERAYKDDMMAFMKALPTNKNHLIIEVNKLTIPNINPLTN